MDRMPLDSSILAWAGYLPDLRLLQVGLRTGEDYEYFDVPAQAYSDLLVSTSKGRYYNLHIRKKFRFRQIKKAQAT